MSDKQAAILIISCSIIIAAILVFTSWRSTSVSNLNRELDRQHQSIEREKDRELERQKIELERERFLLEQEKKKRARELPKS